MEVCPGKSAKAAWIITNPSDECGYRFAYLASIVGGDPAITLTDERGMVSLSPGASEEGNVVVSADRVTRRGVKKLGWDVIPLDCPGTPVSTDWTAKVPDSLVTVTLPGETICPGTTFKAHYVISATPCTEVVTWTGILDAAGTALTANPLLDAGETPKEGDITLTCPQVTKRGKATFTMKVNIDPLGEVATKEAAYIIPKPEISGGITGKHVHPGEKHFLDVTIKNDGPCGEVVTWSVVQVGGIQVNFGAGGGGLVPPGGTLPQQVVQVDIPPDVKPGVSNLALVASVEGVGEVLRKPFILTIGNVRWTCREEPRVLVTDSGQSAEFLCGPGSIEFWVNAQVVDGLKVRRCANCRRTFQKAAVPGQISKYTWNTGGGTITRDQGNRVTIDFAEVGIHHVSVQIDGRTGDLVCTNVQGDTANFIADVQGPKARTTFEDVETPSNRTVAMEWSITNTGRCADTFAFAFTPTPPRDGGGAVAAALRALAAPAPAPHRFGLEVTGWNYAIVGLPDSGAHSPPKAYGSVALQPNQTARGLVYVRVHGGRQGDEGSVNLKVTARGQEVDSVDAKVKIKDYEVELTASDVYLTEANKSEDCRFKIKITGPRPPASMRVTMTIQPPPEPKDALSLNWALGSGLVLTRDIDVGNQGFSGIIKVSAADLALIPKIGKEGLIVTVNAVLPVDVDHPATTTFRVWQSTKNKLLLEMREKPYVYAEEIGVLDIRAVAGDRAHQTRNVELVVTNGEVTTDLNRPFVKTLPPGRPLSLAVDREPSNCYVWKVYYRHAPAAGAPALAPIKFKATWRDDTTETLDQEVRAFKIKAVDPAAVVAAINKTARATLVDKRAGADIRWSLSLANDQAAVVDGQAMAAIDPREGNMQLLLDGGRSAAAYKVKAQLFKDLDENGEMEDSVGDTAPFKAIWGTFDGDRYAGVIPEDGAIVVETRKSKAFILNLQGAGRVTVEVSHKDLVLLDAETKKPIPATLEAATRRACIIQHKGSTGKEGAPFGTIKLTLDEGERAQVLKIDVYVFDPINNAVELVAVSAKDCPVGALPANWDDRIVADMNASWNQQAVIYVGKLKTSSFATSVPVSQAGWTEKGNRPMTPR